MTGVDILWPITSVSNRVVIKSSRTASDMGSLVITLVKVMAVSVWVETVELANADCRLKRKETH